MLSYIIVGSGYRAEYFGRIAARYPGLFSAMFLCRSWEKADLMKTHTSIAATVSADDAEAFRPNFVVVAVDRGHIADVAEEWILRGYPVVTETPVGATMEQLQRLWTLSRKRGARIVCCEQYHRHPIIASGIRCIEAGMIGSPVSAYLSLAHDYHGISLLRRLLQTYDETYTLHGMCTAAEALATDSRYGAILDGSGAQEERDAVHIAFSSGKTAIYDFSPLQYRSYIRSRHLTVRGSRGEWSDRIVNYADDENLPRRFFLMPDIKKEYRALDTQALRDARKTWQPELFLDTLQDEYAIATILLDMRKYLDGGPSPYPLPEALDDAYFWLLKSRAVEHPWEAVTAEVMPWNLKE